MLDMWGDESGPEARPCTRSCSRSFEHRPYHYGETHFGQRTGSIRSVQMVPWFTDTWNWTHTQHIDPQQCARCVMIVVSSSVFSVQPRSTHVLLAGISGSLGPLMGISHKLRTSIGSWHKCLLARQLMLSQPISRRNTTILCSQQPSRFLNYRTLDHVKYSQSVSYTVRVPK